MKQYLEALQYIMVYTKAVMDPMTFQPSAAFLIRYAEEIKEDDDQV